jgi:ribulose-5-phosphate 4-epimerase/fuculose-1-phosphate aldolase
MAHLGTISALRKKVALACRIVGTQGLTRGALEHVSARIPGTDQVPSLARQGHLQMLY